jgi:ABC-type transport system involved in multi-copper enzyme maturation permease subunit
VKLNLALYKRALLTDGRRFVFYGSWLLMGVLLLIILYSLNQFPGGAGGLRFLTFVGYTNFFFILLAGVFGFSSSITEEKEEETIGLLIMTGVSPFTLLVSKAGARFTRGLLLVLSQVPFIILAVTLGGVSPNQVYAVYITLAAFMFFLSLFCTWVSLLSPNNRFSATTCFLAVVVLILLTMLFGSWGLIGYREKVGILQVYAFTEILLTGYNGYFIPEQFYTAISGGFFFFFLSLFTFNEFAMRQPKQGKSKKKVKNGKRAWQTALAWKEFHFQLGGFKSWIAQGLIYIIVLILVLSYTESYERAEALIAFMFFTSWILMLMLLTVIVSVIFSSEFKAGTHSSIFTLPIDHGAIFWSKAFGGFIYLLPSLIIFILTFIYMMNDQGAPPAEVVFIILSNIFVYLCLTSYLSLIIRIGAFIAAGAIIAVFYIIVGLLLFRMIRSGEAFTVFTVIINTVAGLSFIAMTNIKLTEMKSR